MAMTKAEKARLEEIETFAALRWPTAAEPQPMTCDEIKASRVKLTPRDQSVPRERMAALGWVFNTYAMRVEQAWSDGMYHGRNTTGDGGSQGMGCLYRTEAEALLAMRWGMCREFAKKLRAADAMLAERERQP